jgi:aspartokinase
MSECSEPKISGKESTINVDNRAVANKEELTDVKKSIIKVAKFGGTSLADASRFDLVASIIGREQARKIIVCSAPGKRKSKNNITCESGIKDDDVKITDLLINGEIKKAQRRFDEISDKLYLYRFKLKAKKNKSYLISRGEYFSSRVIALITGNLFVDAKKLFIFQNERWEVNEKVLVKALKRASGRAIITGGFYGTKNKQIATFARGGGDISGALLAAKMKELFGDKSEIIYENFTDVDGVYDFKDCVNLKVDDLSADKLENENNKSPKVFESLTYEEMLDIAEGGAQVLHVDAIKVCEMAGVSVVVRNSFNSKAKGTLIK